MFLYYPFFRGVQNRNSLIHIYFQLTAAMCFRQSLWGCSHPSKKMLVCLHPTGFSASSTRGSRSQRTAPAHPPTARANGRGLPHILPTGCRKTLCHPLSVIRRLRPANLLLPGAKRGSFAPGGKKIGLPGAEWGAFAPGKRLPGTKRASSVPGSKQGVDKSE